MRRILVSAVVMIITTLASYGQTPITTTFYLPQIADGIQGSTTWKSSLFVTNPAVSGTSVSNVTIKFTRSDGTPFNIVLIDEVGQAVGSGNTLSFQIANGQTRKFTSRGNQQLAIGYATVTASQPVSATAVFSQFGADGRVLAEAATPSTIPQARQAIIVDTLAGYWMGVAYVNPSSAAASVTLQLVNSAGVAVGTPVARTVPAGAHAALFIHELFPGASSLVGTVQITSTLPLAVMGLRFDPSFSEFTTFTPVTIASLIPDLQTDVRNRQWTRYRHCVQMVFAPVIPS